MQYTLWWAKATNHYTNYHRTAHRCYWSYCCFLPSTSSSSPKNWVRGCHVHTANQEGKKPGRSLVGYIMFYIVSTYYVPYHLFWMDHTTLKCSVAIWVHVRWSVRREPSRHCFAHFTRWWMSLRRLYLNYLRQLCTMFLSCLFCFLLRSTVSVNGTGCLCCIRSFTIIAPLLLLERVTLKKGR